MFEQYSPVEGTPLGKTTLADARPPRTYDRNTVVNRLVGGTDGFLSMLGLTGVEKAYLRAWVLRQGVERTLENLLVCDIIGGSVKRLPSAIQGTELAVARYFKDFTTRVLRGERVIRFATTDDVPFRARFRDLSAWIATGESVYFLNPGERTLLLQLPESEFDSVLRNVSPGEAPTPGESFGALRYSLDRSGRAVIRSITNPFFERLQSPELRKRYEQWEALLIDALLYHLRTAEVLLDGDPLQPEPFDRKAVEVVIERKPPWTRVNDSVRLIRTDELQRTSRIRSACIQKGFVPEILPAGSEIRVRDGRTKVGDVLRTAVVREPGAADSRFVSVKPGREALWWKLFEELRDSDTFLDLEVDGWSDTHRVRFPLGTRSTVHRDRVDAAFELVPSLPVDLAKVVGIDPRRVRLLDRFRTSTDGELVRSIFPPDFLPISRGIGHGIDSRWWDIPRPTKPGIHLFPLHLPSLNRHPSIRLVEVDEAGAAVRTLFLTLKGAGVGIIEDPAMVDRELIPDGARLPMYRRVKRGNDDEVCATHVEWGAMARGFGQTEVLKALAAYDFLKLARDGLERHAPRMLELCKPLSLPIWFPGSTDWVGLHEYLTELLGNSAPKDGGLVAAEALSGSDVRWVDVIKRVFNRSDESKLDLGVMKDEIDSAVAFVYWNHGFSIELPAHGPLPRDGAIGDREVLDYLAAISALNPGIGERIVESVVGGTLDAIAAVHGGGGHLGGGLRHLSKEYSAGAPYGGPMTIRNLDVHGCFHDFDASTFFPWLTGDLSYPGHASRELFGLDRNRKFDLMYWGESRYWIRKILLGEYDGSVNAGVRVDVDKHHDLTVFGGNDECADQLLFMADMVNDDTQPSERFIDHTGDGSRYRAGLELGRRAAAAYEPW